VSRSVSPERGDGIQESERSKLRGASDGAALRRPSALWVTSAEDGGSLETSGYRVSIDRRSARQKNSDFFPSTGGGQRHSRGRHRVSAPIISNLYISISPPPSYHTESSWRSLVGVKQRSPHSKLFYYDQDTHTHTQHRWVICIWF